MSFSGVSYGYYDKRKLATPMSDYLWHIFVKSNYMREKATSYLKYFEEQKKTWEYISTLFFPLKFLETHHVLPFSNPLSEYLRTSRKTGWILSNWDSLVNKLGNVIKRAPKFPLIVLLVSLCFSDIYLCFI